MLLKRTFHIDLTNISHILSDFKGPQIQLYYATMKIDLCEKLLHKSKC